MNIYKVFLHIKETKDLQEDLPQNFLVASHDFVKKMEPLLLESLPLEKYFHKTGNQSDYFYNLFYSDKESILKGLKSLMSIAILPSHTIQDITSRLVEDFLKLPKEDRKKFYQENFSSTVKVPFNYFHNLHTLYCLAHANQEKPLFKKIFNDMEHCLMIPDFLDTYAPGLVSICSIEEIKDNWQNWGLAHNDNLKSIYAEQAYQDFFSPASILFDDKLRTVFLDDIEKGLVPYSLCDVKGKSFMQTMLLQQIQIMEKEFSNFYKISYLNKINDINELVANLSCKYDMSFMDREPIRKEISNLLPKANILRKFDEECLQELLKLSMQIDGFGLSLQKIKRVKI